MTNQVTLVKPFANRPYVEVEIMSEQPETNMFLVQTTDGSKPFVIDPSKGHPTRTDWQWVPTSACVFTEGCTCTPAYEGEACPYCKMVYFGYVMNEEGELVRETA